MDRRARGIYFNRMRWLATRNPMRLSTTEVRDVSPAGAGRGEGARIAIASESKQAGATPRRGRSNHITPGLTPAPRHTRHKSVRRYGDGPGRA